MPNSGSRVMSMIVSGCSISSRIRSTRFVPPPMNFALGSVEIARSAAGTSVARK
jgi:hypothetical protein